MSRDEAWLLPLSALINIEIRQSLCFIHLIWYCHIDGSSLNLNLLRLISLLLILAFRVLAPQLAHFSHQFHFVPLLRRYCLSFLWIQLCRGIATVD